MDAAVLGVRGIDVTTVEKAGKAFSRIVDAINKVSSIRGTIGAQQNRLEHTIAHQMNTAENLTSAESLIRDANAAEEMMGLVRVQILTQAGMSMMMQANMSTQGVLSLMQ